MGQRTDVPRETHLETRVNEAEKSRIRSGTLKTHTDNIPGSPGFNGPLVAPERHAPIEERQGIDVASHPLPVPGEPEDGHEL